jgi:hypothetical protein
MPAARMHRPACSAAKIDDLNAPEEAPLSPLGERQSQPIDQAAKVSMSPNQLARSGSVLRRCDDPAGADVEAESQ